MVLVLKLRLGGEGLITSLARKRSDLHVDFEMMLSSRGILEGLPAVGAVVDLLITEFEVSRTDVSLQVTRVVELLLAVFTVETRYFVVIIVSFHVIAEDTAGDVALAADEALELELLGVELHVIGEGLRRAEYFVTGLTEMLLAAVRL